MTHATPDEARLVEYLLGQVDPEERDRIEEQYLSDPALLEQVNAVERDLIDRYVRGEIANQTAFETHFLASPARRERVAFARALMQSDPMAAGRQQPSARFRPWQLAAAAALALAVGTWLLVSDAPVQTPSGNAGTTPGSLQAPIAPLETPITRPSDTTPLVVTLMLAPTLVRNAGVAPLLVVGNAAEIRLRLEVDATGYESYLAVVRTADGVEIWRQDRLKLESSSGAGTGVTVTVPASRFAGDDYTVTLSGVTSSGGGEEIGGYSFRAQVP